MTNLNKVNNAVHNLTKKDLKQLWIENNQKNLNSEPQLSEHLKLFSDLGDNDKNNYKTTKHLIVLTKQLIEDDKVDIEEYIVNSFIVPAIKDEIAKGKDIKNELVQLSLEETGLDDYPAKLSFNFKVLV